MRLIDADALIDKTDDRYSLHEIGRRERDDIVDALEYAPTIQPEPHWIPVTERLPEVKQRVIVQYADGSMAIKRCIDAGHLRWFYARTVAWMPCPEPYKGVTE